jgi:hypothetical protein
MKLTITVDFESGDGLQMEQNLNKAIDDLSSVLKKKGLREMDLTGVDENLKELYKITIK